MGSSGENGGCHEYEQRFFGVVCGCCLRASGDGIGASLAIVALAIVAYHHHHREPVAGLQLRRPGPGRGPYGLGWRLWLGWWLWWWLECRLGRLRWRLWCGLGRRLASRLGCWLGWECLRLDVVGVAVLTAI
jgi:hypothetical protein